MRQMQSTSIEEADLRIPMHVLECVQEGYKTGVVISNDTDVTVLYPSFFKREWIQNQSVQIMQVVGSIDV